MAKEIRKNLVFLVENLTNLSRILLHLRQEEIISDEESEEIEAGKTNFSRNEKMLTLIQKKDWVKNKELFLKILTKTGNDHCATRIISHEKSLRLPVHNVTKTNVLKSKWWPNEQLLIKSLYKRKLGDMSLVEYLHQRILKEESQMIVICESLNASKLSGLGGVGKTLTANWYAHEYQEKYEHLIWIDCGEGSLLTFFKKLTRDLKIEDRSEFVDLEDFTRKSYEVLEDFKCLWIFDNAENKGIHKFLPSKKQNFSCLITSRRNNEWRTENGYGDIPRFELNLFEESESLEFLRANLKIEYSEDELRELCSRLGNLPLAMQLAVAALNAGKINMRNYTRKNPLKNILDKNFDDYDKTICRNVEISMELIQKEENGNHAHDMLLIFGYISPDQIPMEFFKTKLNLNDEEMEDAINLLTKYFLITILTQHVESTLPDLHPFITSSKYDNDFNSGDDVPCGCDESLDIEYRYSDIVAQSLRVCNEDTLGGTTYLSIHRLLQQVIRHNNRKTEKETLTKILGGDEFLEYKFVPFLQYADEELRNTFPRIKAKLLDQRQLVKLLKENRIEESVQLANFLDKEMNTQTTKFNYALCLENNGQLKEEQKVLEEMLKEDIEVEKIYCSKCVKMGLLKLKAEVSEALVRGHLLLIHWRMRNKRRAQDILEKGKCLTMIESKASLNTSMEILNSGLINSKYFFRCHKYSVIRLQLGVGTNKIHLHNCSINCDIPLSENLQELILEGELPIGQWSLDLRKWIPSGLKRLKIICPLNKKNTRLERLKFEKERLESFALHPGWQVPFITAKDLSKSGFYFLQEDDQVKCIFCEVKIHKWEVGDEPMKEHRKHFCNCPFILNYSVGNIPFGQEIHFRGVMVSLESFSSIEYLDISYCSMNIDYPNKISPKELKLTEVSFISNNQEINEIRLNDFVNFQQINKMSIVYDIPFNRFRKTFLIDMSDELVKKEFLNLCGVTVLNWNEAKWHVQKLMLAEVPFVEQTKMNIEELEIKNSIVDLSILPPSIQKLHLNRTDVLQSGHVNLPNLKYLKLQWCSSSCLSHFSSLQLNCLDFRDWGRLDVDLIPQTVKCIKVGGCINLIGGVRELDKVIFNLGYWLCKDNLEVLDHFKPKLLVLNILYSGGFGYKKYINFKDMLEKEYPTTVIGGIDWADEDFENSILSKHVDRKSQYKGWQ